MSRKSLPKKDQIIWYLCTKCNSNIYVKDRDQHGEYCPMIESVTCTTIRDKQLLSARLIVQTITDDVRGLNAKHLNNLVFLSESVFGLCEFVLGDNVLVSSDALPNGVPIVRSVWPSTSGSSSPTSAAVSEEGNFLDFKQLWHLFNMVDSFTEFRITWHEHENVLISIRKLPCAPSAAIALTLTPTTGSEQIDQMMWKNMQKLLAVQIKGKIYCTQNVVSITFFNKSFSFTISDLVAADDTSSGDDVAALIEQFKSIEIAQPIEYFLVTEKTTFEFNEKNPQTGGGELEAKRTIAKCELIGGMDHTIRDVRKYMNISFGIIKMGANIFVPRTILLYGQHGCGKTLLCDAITESTDALVIKINAADVFSKYFGGTEANLRGHFEKAFKHYPRPSIIVIEELSSICPKDTREESAKRVQMAFLNLMDDIHRRNNASRLFVLTTTSNIDNVNLAARRYGRLDVEIEIPVPDAITREQILIKQLQQTTHNLSDDAVRTIAANSHGYIAADLANLIAKASMHHASNANCDSAEDCVITLADIQYAYGHVVPSAMKEVVIKCPNVKWSDIGGQDELKLQLKQAIEWPLLHPEAFTRMGIAPPRGILMFGPPGCSKTMIAKALATESKVNFLSIKGPELFSMWVCMEMESLTYRALLFSHTNFFGFFRWANRNVRYVIYSIKHVKWRQR